MEQSGGMMRRLEMLVAARMSAGWEMPSDRAAR